MTDSRFKRSVIYLCEHGEDGAMGLVINQPLEQLTLSVLLDKLEVSAGERDPAIRLDKPVFSGGPLAEDRGFILHSPRPGFGSSVSVSSDTMLTTSRDILETLGTQEQPEDYLVALGYSSWGPGQLEQEILDNAWLTVEADTSILFDAPIAERWVSSAAKLGVDIRSIPASAGHA
ncbi:putative transcriptional regulator [Enterobacillus tribolii]|uniref:UPF0301 protein C8D90_102419 n=2 Tax=Enterobacillus tribolii TaxID=1487935 RepID=A0A370R213_9GAMM|nr:putative transcriptional regulator [Enterobacillus tribolii]